ncbi:ZN358-like protein [Mya arenaria]|uniref:DNA-directed DNA polymerase n=1 Tax=Mya arenaria TaxID=6604 RepID=A0ABY7F5U6_MYAAR|nr:ZN358-like protein [Mya arenaria]
MATYSCEECGASFPKLSQLLQHRRTENHWKHKCESCKKSFSRKQNLDRHLLKHNNDNNQHCPECLKVFTREDALNEHLHQEHGWLKAKRASDDQEGGGAAKRQKLSVDPASFYTIEKIGEKKIEKFRSTATYYKVNINDIEVDGLPNILKTLKQIFQSILEHITDVIPVTDLVRISIDNPELDFPITLEFMPRHQLTVDRILSEIERVLQSYQQFVVDEAFNIDIVHVQNPYGKGHSKKPFVDISRLLKSKGSVIQIRNNDELCCARAIVTAKARVENHPEWNNIRQGRSIQQILAEQLHVKAGVPLGKCGIEEVKKFQAALPQYQIHVLSKDHFNGIIYDGLEGGVPIFLYYHDGHYDVITKMTGFLNRSYFCQECKKGYDHKERHICNNPCVYCHHIHSEEEGRWKFCAECNRYFINDTCFKMHLLKSESGKSTCNTYFKCDKCDQTINMNRHKKEHVCNELYCKTCKGFYAEDHLCFMQPLNMDHDSSKKSTSKNREHFKYIFFDFECTQDDILQCETGHDLNENGKCRNCSKAWCGSFGHRPNLCVVHQVCTSCMDIPVNTETVCKLCGKNELVFRGPQTTDDFCKWLFSEENAGATVICHNFKGYDSYPILQYLHENAVLPEVITTGSKYMSINVPVCNIRMIDSLNFIPMALADMPRAFGQTELVKGYFPHLFNRKENQYVILPQLPEIKHYTPDNMKPDARRAFLIWYAENRNNVFDFKEEILRYCRSDVDILRRCCLKFRSLFMGLTKKGDSKGIDPFAKCITIASACNLVYRTLFLEPESIAIIPPHGYNPEEKQSKIAYGWLAYYAHTTGLQIQHGRNGGEKQIGPYKVDGYYEVDGEKVALEFHGCFWHGCPKCFSKTSLNPVRDMKMGDLYISTMEKKQFIEENGCTYVCNLDINFQTVKDMVTGNRDQCVTVVDNNKIVRNQATGHVITKRETKDYKIVFDKRVIGSEYNTYPYGY